MEAAGPPPPLAGHEVGGSSKTSLHGIPVPSEKEKPNQAVEGLKDVIYGSVSAIMTVDVIIMHALSCHGEHRHRCKLTL